MEEKEKAELSVVLEERVIEERDRSPTGIKGRRKCQYKDENKEKI